MVGKCVVGDPPHLANESQLHADMHSCCAVYHAQRVGAPKLLNLDTSHVLKMQGKAEKNWEEKTMGHVSATLPSDSTSSSCF